MLFERSADTFQLRKYAPLRVRTAFRRAYTGGMKVIRFEEKEGDDVPAPIPEVPASVYGELFFAADWVVLNRPWETAVEGKLFEVMDSSGQESWQAFLNSNGGGVCIFLLVRKSNAKVSGAHERLEVQFIGSDFLQGHDYELNVRYAPEAWDACDLDVIVLRAFDGEREPEHPNPEQVKILSDGLLALRSACEKR